MGDAEPDRHVQDLLGQSDQPLHLRAAAGQHHAARDQILESAAAELGLDEDEQLLVTRLDDLAQDLAGEPARRPIAHARHLDGLVGRRELRERAGVPDLDLLGVLGRRAQRHRDVVGDVVPGDRDDRGMPDGAVAEDREVGGAAADVDEADPQLPFVVEQHRLARRELLEDDVVDLEAAAAHALGDVLHRAHRAGHHVDLRLQAHPRHAGGLPDPFLAVDDVFLRDGVEDLLIGRDRDGPRGVDDALHVFRGHFLVPDRHHPVGVEAADVAARDAGEHRVDLAPRHQLRLFHRAPDRLHGGFDVHHHPLLQPARRMDPHPDDLDPVGVRDLADDGGHLRRADVEPHDEALVRSFHPCTFPPDAPVFMRTAKPVG